MVGDSESECCKGCVCDVWGGMWMIVIVLAMVGMVMKVACVGEVRGVATRQPCDTHS